MQQPIQLESGRSYRLRRELEVRDEKTGTLKFYFLGGTVVKVRRVIPDEDRVWIEGTTLPVPLIALSRMVDPVA